MKRLTINPNHCWSACGANLLVVLAILSVLSCVVAPASVCAQPLNQLQVPARPSGAATGTQFKDTILNMARADREVAIYREVAKGNIPDFQRTLVPVTLTGGGHTAVIYVLPDYLAIGSDADHFYMPMTPILAQWVADLTSTTLPTRKMVGATWTAAPVKLNPSPIAPSAAMVTVPVFWDHNVTVRGQRSANAAALGTLVGGNKKDVVVSPQLVTYTNFKRVAIFGWHQSNGVPIQNIYFGHEETYADYSHGIRLVNKRMLLNGNETTVEAVLLVGAIEMWCEDRITAQGDLPTWAKVLIVMMLVAGMFGSLLMVLHRMALGSLARAHRVVRALPLPTPLLLLHLLLVAMLMIVFPFSKLLHAPGLFFSPSRNQVDNPREQRHVADWAKRLEQ
jgi:hypothetical protein